MTLAPTRFVNAHSVVQRLGERAARLGPLYFVGDDAADAAAEALSHVSARDREKMLGPCLKDPDVAGPVPEAVRAFCRGLHEVPFWVDFPRAGRGGSALLRTGLFGGIVLAFRSLVLGYCSPAGNKPLVFSGRLKENAARRVTETGRFVQAVSMPDGMRPGRAGFVATARVRLMHAQVRRLLQVSPKWDREAWGVPINQVDMSATVTLFSLVVIDGLRMLGVPFRDEEAEDLLHLWRWTGRVMGVRDELLPTGMQDARVLWDMIEATEGAPDSDSADLAHALLDSAVSAALTPEDAARAKRFGPVAYGLSRFLIGDKRADALGYPKSVFRHLAPAFRTLVTTTGTWVRRIPGADRVMLDAGLAYWQRSVQLTLSPHEAEFPMPEQVRHA